MIASIIFGLCFPLLLCNLADLGELFLKYRIQLFHMMRLKPLDIISLSIDSYALKSPHFGIIIANLSLNFLKLLI